ncbi:hypothetical protein G6M87_11035 [Rhizobium rhizogenes]|uniref:hypothetical protein n=1 Tax=Rhizobium rhizogenes TaxID=359 RepID=UPI0015730028|nr:hypothetical protein [Rhizobium rhizogenes]NTI22392.1 hypothetical protein [Rhizobium rhizogenes]QTG05977.1 hypothetical protein G6M87_11035 [Rhizobium rhizogenes]
MLLSGTIEIFGMKLPAIMSIHVERNNGGRGASQCPNGKWRAYNIENGKNVHRGYYATESEALEAARQGRNIAAEKKARRKGMADIHRVQRRNSVMWRSTYRRADGQRFLLGDYVTPGNAVLVRDVVARRCGGHVEVPDYEMPLALVSNAVARSFILDPISQASQLEIDEFQRRVTFLNSI